MPEGALVQQDMFNLPPENPPGDTQDPPQVDLFGVIPGQYGIDPYGLPLSEPRKPLPPSTNSDSGFEPKPIKIVGVDY